MRFSAGMLRACLGLLCLVAGQALRPFAATVDSAPQPEAAPAFWRSDPEAGSAWIWETQFPELRRIAAIFQKLGDHPFVLRNAPVDYEWQATLDGVNWHQLPGTRAAGERRLIRVLPLRRPVEAKALRLVAHKASGESPALQEFRCLESLSANSDRTDWILVVNSTHDPTLPGHGREFIPLAQSCPGWERLAAQQVWVADFDPALLAVEPRPLAVFLSGSFKDWCEVDRSHWRGAEKVLLAADTPIWASCGGAQALAILADRGTRRPWDCPHCRDPRHPRLPIYGHIGHREEGAHRCGDYSACTFERGPHAIRQVAHDLVFRGLPEVFDAMESHCGQIEYAPSGWEIVATGGPGTLTRNQCLRLRGRPIYAAQFHIEMEGTPDSSRAIMANFLALAKAWRQGR